MPKFDVNDLLMRDYTPAAKNMWRVSFPNLANIQIPAFLAESFGRPKWSFEEHEINYMSKKRYVAGKLSYEPLSVVLYEPIDMSASTALIAWLSLVQEIRTGLRSYVSAYKKDVVLELLDGVKNVTQKWTLKGSWPINPDFGDLDYTTGEPLKITLSLRFDEPILEF